jgi:hypothetical protein
MALVLKDRVQETTTTTGTGTVTLDGAVSGFQSFSAIGNSNTCYYAIVGGTEWEVGLGTYTSSGTTLSRDTILESSNSGSAVNFSAGTKNVFVTYPAEKSIYQNASGVANLTSTDVTTALGYTPVTDARTLTINGTSYDLTANRTWSVGTVTSVTGTAPIASSGGATPAISISQATTSTDGYLSSTDWNTFNNKGSGTVTSVAALTLGTTGTDLTSTVANGTTTPVITLNVPTASAANRGVLSSADWTTFNNKGSGTVTSVSWTGGIVSVATATSTPAFTIAGTSGGIPYFSSGTTWASSGALAANAIVIGGGAGVAPSTTTTGTGVLTALGIAVNSGAGGLITNNGTATLTNKTLTTPVISSITNTGTLTLPTSTDTLVGRATTDTLTNKTLTNPVITGTIEEDVFTITDGAGFAIDPTNGSIQLITLGANRTPTQANWAAGEAITLMIDDGTAYTITWTTLGVVWVGASATGSAPTLGTSGYSIIELWKVGTTIYGAFVGVA